MKKISSRLITETVARLCIEANLSLRKDVSSALNRALKIETNPRAKSILKLLVENARCAKTDRVALCQDTGMPVVFVEIGKDVDLSGLDLTSAINHGVEEGYKKGYLRNSIVHDPIERGVSKFSPCVIHYDHVRRRGLRLTVLPKGFGCENKTQLKMFNPTASLQEIKDFIISSVEQAGPDACPPYILGIGIGGTSDYACLLSKKALLKLVTSHESYPDGHRQVTSKIKRLEQDLLKKINQLNIGPMGLGGKTTAFGVSVLTYPTHIAGLPVCVNISCHALRSASKVL